MVLLQNSEKRYLIHLCKHRDKLQLCVTAPDDYLVAIQLTNYILEQNVTIFSSRWVLLLTNNKMHFTFQLVAHFATTILFFNFQISPQLINTHCVAHRLALAVGATGNEIMLIKFVLERLDTIYRHYQKSFVRTSGL